MNGDLAQIFGGGFDSNSVEPQGDFEVMPPGKYPVLIEAAEVKQTKAGTGVYLKLTFSVLDGKYKNCKLFENINIQNPNQQCVEIGLRTLAALGLAISVANISDTSQLLNKTCLASVKVAKDQAGNEQNQIRTFASLAGYEWVNQPAQQSNVGVMPFTQYTPPSAQRKPPQAQQVPPTLPQANGASKPPWMR